MKTFAYRTIEDNLDFNSIIESFIKKGLVSFYSSSQKISKELVFKSIELHDKSSSIQRKFIGIWVDSINYLNEIEFKYGTSLPKKLSLINKKYKDVDFTKDEILGILTDIRDIKKCKDSVAREYLYVIKFIYRIRKLHSITFEKNPKTSNPFSPDFINNIFRKENFDNKDYYSLMTGLFIDLSIHCYILGEICKTPIGVPISEEVRQERATKAAIARHEKSMLAGENFLYERIFSLIEKLNMKIKYKREDEIKKFRNIHSFVTYEKKLFQVEVDEYKKMLGKPAIDGGLVITFGEDLDLSELVKLMNKWRKKDKFNALIKNFLYAPKITIRKSIEYI